VTGQDPRRWLLDKTGAREQALAREAEKARTLIDDLAARLREPNSTRQPVICRSPARPCSRRPATEPATEPAEPPAVLPGHPACQRILTVFADAGQPMRARDPCQALDLPVVPENTGNLRSKLKRLASRGILVETEPGLFTQPRP
jgi:hypothetical protein